LEAWGTLAIQRYSWGDDSMGEKLRGKVLDFTDPGWRDRPLMAAVLAHQKRIRNDRKIQAARERVHRDSLREIRFMSMGFLLLPIACWLAYALVTETPWRLALNDCAARMYIAWAISVAGVHVLLSR
jgi:hypothetical protein